MTVDKLRAANFEYVRRRTSNARTGQHADVLLDEFIEEARLGRGHWPGNGTPRRPQRRRHVGGAFCWGRLRRQLVRHAAGGRERQGEDTSRGKLKKGIPQRHCQSVGRPHAPYSGGLVAMAGRLAADGAKSTSSATTSSTFTGSGQYATRHLSRCGSIWRCASDPQRQSGTLRGFADALQLLTRMLTEHADSAFNAFSDLFVAMGKGWTSTLALPESH